jgi:hypothetical protein
MRDPYLQEHDIAEILLKLALTPINQSSGN